MLYSKENNTSENPIPRREISQDLSVAFNCSLKSVDHVKYEGQVRSQHLLFAPFSRCVELSSCRVTYENYNKPSGFFNVVCGECIDLRNSNGIELKNFYLTTVQKLFSKIFTEVEKCIMWCSIQVLPNQVSTKILLYG